MQKSDRILITATLDANPSLRGTLHLVEGREKLAELIGKPVNFVIVHLGNISRL